MLNDKKDQTYVSKLADSIASTTCSFAVKASGTETFQLISKTSKTYDELQEKGRKNGCWECKAKMGSAGAAAWVMDHIPPSGLTKHHLGKLADALNAQQPARKAVQSWTDYRAAKRRAVLSCHNCSVKKSKLVKLVKARSKKGKIDELVADLTVQQKGMLFSFNGRPSVKISGLGTSSARSRYFKKYVSTKCHVCSKKNSTGLKTAYTADHHPPTELITTYAQAVFTLAGKPLPDCEVRPHCKKCSSKQGGNWKAIAAELQQIAKRNGIVVYK